MKLIVILTTITVVHLFFVQKISAQVVINEILPAPASGYSDGEWVELLNISGTPVNLKGWQLKGKTIDQEITLNPQDFIIVSKNTSIFASRYNPSGLEHQVAQLAISLANSGGLVELKAPAGVIVDQVTYPGFDSMRERSYERIMESSGNVGWYPHCYGHTAGMSNYNLANSSNSARCPKLMYSGDQNNYSEILEVKSPTAVSVKLDEDLTPLEWLNNGQLMQQQNLEVTYPTPKVVAKYHNLDQIYEFKSDGLITWPDASFKEIRPSQNMLKLTAAEGVDFDGWEILNDSGAQLALDDMECTDGMCELSFPAGSVSATDTLKLLSPTGFEIDFVSFANISGEKYVQISEDGTLLIMGTESATVPTELQISRVFPSPASGAEEWLELYNWGTRSIQLAGWIVKDTSSPESLQGLILPGKHLIVKVTKISLNNSGDELELLSPAGVVVDTFSYGTTETGAINTKQFNIQEKKYQNPVTIVGAELTDDAESVSKAPLTVGGTSNGANHISIRSHFVEPNISANQLVTSFMIRAKQVMIPLWHIALIANVVSLGGYVLLNRSYYFRLWDEVQRYR